MDGSASTRYLVRLANKNRLSPDKIQTVSYQIRKTLGSKEDASHFRVATNAFEFNLFAKDLEELDEKKRLLRDEGFEVLGEKLLDTPPITIEKVAAVREAVELFNEERFWESHEVLEQTWRSSTGPERDTLQGVILTAAAFVHYQKGEQDTCLSVLNRARGKIGEQRSPLVDLAKLRDDVDRILDSGKIRLFKIQISRD